MSSEDKALVRLKICEKIIEENQEIERDKLEAMMFYSYGILPRTVAKYVDCLSKLGKITINRETKTIAANHK